MNSQATFNNSQLTTANSQVRQADESFDWDSCDSEDYLSSSEEVIVEQNKPNFDESSRDMNEELRKAFFVGAKFKSMEELRENSSGDW